MDGASANEFSVAEQDLIRAVLAGVRIDLERRPIRAGVLRDLILEARPGWRLPETGLRIERMIIQGNLDLEGATVSKPILVWHARFEPDADQSDDVAILLRDGRFRHVSLNACTIQGDISADRVEIEKGLSLGGCKITGRLLIRGGKIDGPLALDGIELGTQIQTNADGSQADQSRATGLQAAGLRLGGPLILRRARIVGEISLPRAALASGILAEALTLEAAALQTIPATAAPAFNLESGRIGGDIHLDRAVLAGGISLRDARLEGRLSADALIADRLPIAFDVRGLTITNGVDISGARLRGALALDRAQIGMNFSARDIEIDGEAIAISAEASAVRGTLDLSGASLAGQVFCPGLKIDGQLRMASLRLNATPIAIAADHAEIRGGWSMAQASVVGRVSLASADIGDEVILDGATIKSSSGAAVFAAGARVRRDVRLNAGFQTIGGLIFDQARIAGCFDLSRSYMKSAAIARAGLTPTQTHGSEASEPSAQSAQDEIALSLVGAHIGRLVMPCSSDQRPRGIVDLSAATVTSFEDYADAWPPTAKDRNRSADGRDIDHLVIDGFSYQHLVHPAGIRPGSGSGTTAKSAIEQPRWWQQAGARPPINEVAAHRIAWLESQQADDLDTRFKPRPWTELATRLRQQGYDQDARAISIAGFRRERRGAGLSGARRWQSRFLDWFALYGHAPWRTVWCMAGVIALFALVWAGAAQLCSEHECFDEGVFAASHRDGYSQDGFRQSYPGFHSLAYSIDVFVPVVDLGFKRHWRPNMNFGPITEIPWPLASANSPPALHITVGGLLYLLMLVEALLGIALTALAALGFTGMLKRTHS